MAQLSSAWLVGQGHASCDRRQRTIKSTGKFKVHEVTYDKGGFAVATSYWDDGSDLRLDCKRTLIITLNG
jgi:hypothetical protein